METALAVAVLVGIFVVIFGLRWVTGKASDKIGEKVHQAMNKGDLDRQNYLWDRTWTWKTAAAWSEIRSAFDREVDAIVSTLPGMKVIAESESGLRVGFNFKGARLTQGAIHFGGVTGARADSEYEFQADLDRTDDQVTFRFVQVKILDGVARCVSEMEQFLASVERAVKTADPAAREVE